MKRTFQASFLFAVLATLSSCASIVSKSSWPVSVNSNPAGATITITNRKGNEVYKGTAPAMINLKSGAGFFKKESYIIHYELAGYATKEIPLECRVNGWYWGNLLLGGVLGMLIIDPATGAMYKLNTETVQGTLVKNSTGSVDTEPSLKICSIKDIPRSMEKQLVKIN